jgi:Kef-type K+ transport system membrane component KefB
MCLLQNIEVKFIETIDMVTFFLEIAVMLSVTLLCGQLMSRLRLPAVFGELFGGIILGPTVWGWLSPGTYQWLFPTSGAVFPGQRRPYSDLCAFLLICCRSGDEPEPC